MLRRVSGPAACQSQPHTGPNYLRPRREFVALEPGESIRVAMQLSRGSYVFTNNNGRFIVRPWWPNAILGGPRKKLQLAQAGICDISLLL